MMLGADQLIAGVLAACVCAVFTAPTATAATRTEVETIGRADRFFAFTACDRVPLLLLLLVVVGGVILARLVGNRMERAYNNHAFGINASMRWALGAYQFLTVENTTLDGSGYTTVALLLLLLLRPFIGSDTVFTHVLAVLGAHDRGALGASVKAMTVTAYFFEAILE
jgi:hypothetical protein